MWWFGIDYIGSGKTGYHTITTTPPPPHCDVTTNGWQGEWWWNLVRIMFCLATELYVYGERIQYLGFFYTRSIGFKWCHDMSENAFLNASNVLPQLQEICLYYFFLSKALFEKNEVSYFPTIDVDYKFHFSIGCHYTIGSLVLMYSSHDRKYTSGVSIIHSILP
jgi:hypothetical protein